MAPEQRKVVAVAAQLFQNLTDCLQRLSLDEEGACNLPPLPDDDWPDTPPGKGAGTPGGASPVRLSPPHRTWGSWAEIPSEESSVCAATLSVCRTSYLISRLLLCRYLCINTSLLLFYNHPLQYRELYIMSGVTSKMAAIGSVNNPVKYADQDFEKLKAEHLASGTLFEDPEFPAAQSSMGKATMGPQSKMAQGLEWKRPTEISKNPEFIVAGAEREDICQGELSDCWFLSSIACLTMNKECLYRVVPQDQSFKKDYVGIFHFMFWQYGEWVDVVIDDRLPTKNNKLLFVKSETTKEFWTTLLEKAYAKLNGSYEGLNVGFPAESLQDFTGGVGEDYLLRSAPADLFKKIQNALEDHSLVCCNTVEDPDDDGLVKSHAYSIIRAEEVTLKDGSTVQLIRLRNPWGFQEWTGAWSDGIPFPDFLKEFKRVYICDISLSETFSGDNFKWLLTEFHGSWKKGQSSGGKLALDTFWMNPQFRITVAAEGGDTSKECPIIVCLSQKDRRRKTLEGVKEPFLEIGFYIFKVNPGDTIPLQKEFFKNNSPVACVDGFRRYLRDGTGRFQLLPGDYVIVAATSKESDEADFYLRVYSKKLAKP
ncbi:calpain-8-like isoform X2 [Hyla sarda]|uniref:calpain-8-like isoform X2 n=1 Tax=Hyla sarda TaxID=327740 RepID=UPI0024C2D152|nr:calpain-8-like isoform X2 [Hyla sarda]